MNDDKINELLDTVCFLSSYDLDRKVLFIYAKKLEIKILDYTNLEELNAPLINFLEDKLINIANFFKDNSKSNTSSSAVIDGLSIDNVKSINRGDTTITLKDSSGSEETRNNINDLLAFGKRDYSILDLHRKLRWQV